MNYLKCGEKHPQVSNVTAKPIVRDCLREVDWISTGLRVNEKELVKNYCFHYKAFGELFKCLSLTIHTYYFNKEHKLIKRINPNIVTSWAILGLCSELQFVKGEKRGILYSGLLC